MANPNMGIRLGVEGERDFKAAKVVTIDDVVPSSIV